MDVRGVGAQMHLDFKGSWVHKCPNLTKLTFTDTRNLNSQSVVANEEISVSSCKAVGM